MNVFKKVFTTITAVATIAWSVGLSAFVPVAQAAVTSGSLIKASGAAVYYYGANGKRYVFPNETTYKTWYADFSSVMTITDAELAAIQIGGNVTFRPGVKLGKVTTDPKVYAIDANGSLRWIKTEAVAIALYGANWGALVSDIPDAFFTNYTYGADINSASDYNPAGVTATASSINVDKGLGSTSTPTQGTGGSLTVALASDTPAGQSVPAGATPATNVSFTKVNFTAGSNAVVINKLTVTRSGLSADNDVSAVKLMDGATQLDTAQTLNSAHQATFNVNKTVAAGTTWSVVIAADLAGNNTASSEMRFGIAANTDVNSNASSISGAPVFGNTMVLTNISVGSLSIAQGAQMPADNDGLAPWTTSYDIGDDKVVFALRLTAGSVEDVKVTSITFESGDNSTIQTGDISNIRLINDTTGQTMATLTSLDSKGNAVFDLSANPLVLAKGVNRDLIVKAKVENGAARIIAFDVNDGTSFLVRATGSTYGFGVALTDGLGWTGATGIGNGVNINQGTLTVSKAATSPAAGNIAKGGTDLTLVDYSYEIKGEDIRIGGTEVDLALTDSAGNLFTAGTCATVIDSVKLVDAKTGVVLAGPVTPAGNVTAGVGGETDTCTATFSSSYELPNGPQIVRVTANTTSAMPSNATVIATVDRVYTIKGLTSNKTITPNPTTVQTSDNAGVAGNTMTVKGAVLGAQLGASPIAQSVVKGKVSYNVAYLGLDSSAGGEDVRVSTIGLTNAGAENGDWVNARLINTATGAQVGTTVQPVANVASFTFSGDELVVLKTQQVNLAVQVDILSTACSAVAVAANVLGSGCGAAEADTTADSFSFTITSLTGTGKASATGATASINATASPVQTIIDSGLLKVTLDADTATAAQLVSSSTGNSVVTYKFEATNEAIDVTDIYLTATNGGANGSATFGADFASIEAYVNGVKVGSTLSATNNGLVLLSLASGTFTIGKDSSKALTIKANLQNKTNVTSGTLYRFGIADKDVVTTTGVNAAQTWAGVDAYKVTATGQDSGSSITNINSTGAAGGVIVGGNTMSAHDGVLTVTLNAASPSGLKVASANQELMRINLTATGDDVTFGAADISVTHTGAALTAAGPVNFVSTDGNNTVYAATAAVTAAAGTSLLNAVRNATTLQITAGTTKTIKLETNTLGKVNPNSIQVLIDNHATTPQTVNGLAWYATDKILIDGTVAGLASVQGLDAAVTGALWAGPATKELPLFGGAISY